jgi:hypothetical protein
MLRHVRGLRVGRRGRGQLGERDGRVRVLHLNGRDLIFLFLFAKEPFE